MRHAEKENVEDEQAQPERAISPVLTLRASLFRISHFIYAMQQLTNGYGCCG